jgi:nickel/cobalt transporter (NicO) family protein
MTSELSILLIAAISIGFFHTLFGPDHYLPFIVMAKSGNWSLRKTTLITLFCGLGHILGSVTLGLVGIVFGIAVTRIEAFESFRGNLAAWALIAFGLVYFAWGVRQAIRNKPHKHIHPHMNGTVHDHIHSHNEDHIHAHVEKQKKTITPWILFTIFVFGPCEPLIPLLMYPAARGTLWNLIFVTAAFSVITIITMIGIVLISAFGVSFIPVGKFERYIHAMAGATILICGMSIQFLGL